MNKHRMNKELFSFAARLRDSILSEGRVPRVPDIKIRNGDSWNSSLRDFDSLALELFALQFENNAAYRKICEARGLTPKVVEHWTQIPAVPTGAFKELELSCIPPEERTAVFHSSGTTEQKPSRHFHNAESLAVYEASLWTWFEQNLFARFRIQNSEFRIDDFDAAAGSKRRIPRSSTCLKPCGKNSVGRASPRAGLNSSANWRPTVRGLWILTPRLPR